MVTRHYHGVMDHDWPKLSQELDRALARYIQWERPLRRFRAENYRRLNQDGYTWEIYQEELAELEDRLADEKSPHAMLRRLFDQVCAAFIVAGADQQATIRAFVAERKALGLLLWRFANYLTHRLSVGINAPRVATALAAIAIDNCSANYRDTLMTLADLYVAAESGGIDPRPLFAAAANWATDEVTPGGCESLAAMLRDFHESSVLRERRLLGEPYGGPI
jgi:hypothetical protein